MAKVSYDPKADPEAGLPENTSQFGYDFIGTKPVEVSNVQHLQKFAGNPHFKVHGTVPGNADTVRTTAERESAKLGTGSQAVVTGQEKAAPAIVPEPSQPQKSDKVTPGQADKPDGDSAIRAVHQHDDVFVIKDGDTNVELGGAALTGKEAERFNALNAKQKREYIANYPAEQKKAADKAAAEKLEEKKKADAAAAKAHR